MAAGITGVTQCRFCSGGIHHDEDAIPEDGNCVLGGWVSNVTDDVRCAYSPRTSRHEPGTPIPLADAVRHLRSITSGPRSRIHDNMGKRRVRDLEHDITYWLDAIESAYRRASLT